MKKYEKGEKITSIHTAIEQEYLYFHHKLYHQGWFFNWSISWLQNQIKYGTIYMARKIEIINIWSDEFNKISPNSQFMERTK